MTKIDIDEALAEAVPARMRERWGAGVGPLIVGMAELVYIGNEQITRAALEPVTMALLCTDTMDSVTGALKIARGLVDAVREQAEPGPVTRYGVARDQTR